MKRHKILLILALLAFVTVAAFLGQPQPAKMSILAVSDVHIEPQGQESETGEWTGSYWVVSATTDCVEDYLFYELDQAEVEKYGSNKIGNKTILPGANLRITLDPLQPYYRRALVSNQVAVTPSTPSYVLADNFDDNIIDASLWEDWGVELHEYYADWERKYDPTIPSAGEAEDGLYITTPKYYYESSQSQYWYYGGLKAKPLLDIRDKEVSIQTQYKVEGEWGEAYETYLRVSTGSLMDGDYYELRIRHNFRVVASATAVFTAMRFENWQWMETFGQTTRTYPRDDVYGWLPLSVKLKVASGNIYASYKLGTTGNWIELGSMSCSYTTSYVYFGQVSNSWDFDAVFKWNEFTYEHTPPSKPSSILPVTATYYEFAGGSWEVHSPFQITVTKAGTKPFEKTVTIDTVGGVGTVVITNPDDTSEQLMIKDLGKLGTGYEIALPDVLIFDTNNVLKKEYPIVNVMSYDADPNSYSYYWFGTRRVDGHPYPYWDQLDNYPGWEWHQGYAQAITPSVYSDRPTTPTGKSVINYLKDRGFSTTDLDVWNQGVEIEQGDHLKIMLPYSSVNSLITMTISTELADSFVYQPMVGEGKVQSVKWAISGTSHSDINDLDDVILTVKNVAPVKATLTILTDVSTPSASIVPITVAQNFEPNETKSFIFTVKNLGVTSDTPGIVTFIVKDSLGNIDDLTAVTFNLLPSIVDGEDDISNGNVTDGEENGDHIVSNTTLNIYVLDGTSFEKISGASVKVITRSYSGTSITQNGSVSFNLGNYTGDAEISVSAEGYKTTSRLITLDAGFNTKIFYLGKAEKFGDLPLMVAALGVVAVAAVIIVIGLKLKRRKRRLT